MTEPQKKLHWNGRHGQPGWYGVAGANAWQMEKGRLRENALKSKESEWHAGVWACAAALAKKENRSVTAEDLRHGCYAYALGAPKSSNDFTNSDLDRVFIIFRLLVNPDDLKAVADWREYQRFDQAKKETVRCREQRIHCTVELPEDPGERRRQLFFIRQTPEAVVLKFLRDGFHGRDLEDLELWELRNLSKTLHNRKKYNDRPVSQEQAEMPEPLIAEEPF